MMMVCQKFRKCLPWLWRRVNPPWSKERQFQGKNNKLNYLNVILNTYIIVNILQNAYLRQLQVAWGLEASEKCLCVAWHTEKSERPVLTCFWEASEAVWGLGPQRLPESLQAWYVTKNEMACHMWQTCHSFTITTLDSGIRTACISLYLYSPPPSSDLGGTPLFAYKQGHSIFLPQLGNIASLLVPFVGLSSIHSILQSLIKPQTVQEEAVHVEFGAFFCCSLPCCCFYFVFKQG